MDLGAKLVHSDLNNDALGYNQFLISINFITDDIQENHAKIIPKRPFSTCTQKGDRWCEQHWVKWSLVLRMLCTHCSMTLVATVAINLHVDLVYPDLLSYAYKPQAKLISCFSLTLAPALSSTADTCSIITFKLEARPLNFVAMWVGFCACAKFDQYLCVYVLVWGSVVFLNTCTVVFIVS